MISLKFFCLCIGLFLYNTAHACNDFNCFACAGGCSQEKRYEKNKDENKDIVPLKDLSVSSVVRKRTCRITYSKGRDGKPYCECIEYPAFAAMTPEKIQASFVVNGYLKSSNQFTYTVESLYRNRDSFDHILSLRGDELKGILRYLSMKCNESGLPVFQESFLNLANKVHNSRELMRKSIYIRYDSQAIAGGMALLLSFFDSIIESLSSGLFDTVFIEESKFDICDGRYILMHLSHDTFARHLGPVKNDLLWRTALVSGGISALITVFVPKIRDRLIPYALKLYAFLCKKNSCCSLRRKKFNLNEKNKAEFIKITSGLSKEDAELLFKRFGDPKFMDFLNNLSLLIYKIDVVAELLNSLIALEKEDKSLFDDVMVEANKTIFSMDVLRMLSHKDNDERAFNELFNELADNIIEEEVSAKHGRFQWLFLIVTRGQQCFFVVFVYYAAEFFMQWLIAIDSEAIIEVPVQPGAECLGFNASASRDEMFQHFGNETTIVSGNLYSMESGYYTGKFVWVIKLAIAYAMVNFADWVDKKHIERKKKTMLAEVGYGGDVHLESDSEYIDMSFDEESDSKELGSEASECDESDREEG